MFEPQRERFVRHLMTMDAPVTPGHLAGALGMSVGRVKNLLTELVRAGRVTRVGHGQYVAEGNVACEQYLRPDRWQLAGLIERGLVVRVSRGRYALKQEQGT